MNTNLEPRMCTPDTQTSLYISDTSFYHSNDCYSQGTGRTMYGKTNRQEHHKIC